MSQIPIIPPPPPPPAADVRRSEPIGGASDLEAIMLREHQEALEISKEAAIQQAVMHGFVVYVSHPGLSVRNVWEHFRVTGEVDSSRISAVVSYGVFLKYARDDQWEDKRDRHWASVEQRVLEHLQTDHVKAELRELEGIEKIEDELQKHIFGRGKTRQARARSLEGIVKAVVELDKLKSAKRDRVAKATAASATPTPATVEGDDPLLLGNEEVGSPVEDNLSDEEAAQVADFIARQRAGMLVEDSADDVDHGRGKGQGEE